MTIWTDIESDVETVNYKIREVASMQSFINIEYPGLKVKALEYHSDGDALLITHEDGSSHILITGTTNILEYLKHLYYTLITIMWIFREGM